MRDEVVRNCGGCECPIDPQVLAELMACAWGLPDGSIAVGRTQIHIFGVVFANDVQGHLALDLGELSLE